MFESVLQVKGFTTVTSPGGAIKVIPVREAKESNIETVRSSLPPPDRDRFVTRLIPLRYIDAESIVNTLKPLVSKDASMAAYVETNTVILTESASNIRRLLAILEAIDVETYKEELAVLKVEYADATALAEQVSQIYGAEVVGGRRHRAAAAGRAAARARCPASGGRRCPPVNPARGRVRIITDSRTNSLIVLAARAQLEDVRGLVRKLDVPVTGGGRIHVYYLQYADAEELAPDARRADQRAGRARPARAAAAAGLRPAAASRRALRGRRCAPWWRASPRASRVTADPATNALVIQASQEGYATIARRDREARHRAPAGAGRGADHGGGRHRRHRARLQRAVPADQRRHRHHDRAGRRRRGGGRGRRARRRRRSARRRGPAASS